MPKLGYIIHTTKFQIKTASPSINIFDFVSLDKTVGIQRYYKRFQPSCKYLSRKKEVSYKWKEVLYSFFCVKRVLINSSGFGNKKANLGIFLGELQLPILEHFYLRVTKAVSIAG